MQLKKLYGVLMIMTLLLPILLLSGVNQTYAATSKAWTYNGDPTKVKSIAVSKGLEIVNKQNPVPNSYKTPSVNVAETKKAFAELVTYAKLKKNYTIEGFSWDRTYDYQSNLYSNAVKTMGQIGADTQSAKPGFSEHHTGFAVDYVVKGIGCAEMESTCASKAEYKWVNENAYLYGFIVRYTAENTDWTGYNAEYWHLRYIGKAEALKYHTTKAKSLEEYVGMSKGQTLLTLPNTMPIVNALTSIKTTDELLSTLADTPLSSNTDSSDSEDTSSSITVSKDTYTFVDSGILRNKATSKDDESLFPNILKEKQSELMTSTQTMVTGKLDSTTFKGGLYTDSTSLWASNYDTKAWITNTSATIIYMETSTKAYKIEIPAGNGGTTNKAVINNAIAAVDMYKEMVKESIFTGLMSASYNVYTMTPSKQMLVRDIVEKEMNSGKFTGYYTIKAGGTGYNMKYSLKEFYHPLLGKLVPTTLGTDQATIKENLKKSIPTITFDVGTEKGSLSFELSQDYSTFFADIKSGGGLYTKVDSKTVNTTNGVKSYKTTHTKKEVLAESRIDGSFPLALPSTFVKGDLKYQLSNVSGYDISAGVSLMLSNATVYEAGGEGEGRTALSDFSTFGIDLDSLALSSIKVDAEGKPTNVEEGSATIGVIIPLWYKEVVVNTLTESGVVGEEDNYFTGRVIRFNNDYNEKVVLDNPNSDLVSAVTKTTGTLGIELRRFSFLTDADVTLRASHEPTSTTPEKFKIIAEFITDKDADYRGLVIYRNNAYISDDALLVSWLGSDSAMAMTDVDAEFLLKLINGEIGLEDDVLAYEDWVRMQEIKGELDSTFRSKLISIINIFSIILGYFIIIYSITLMLAYWFDIVNTVFEFSLLKVLSGGRLYAIPNKDALDYISSYAGDDLKFVTYVHMFIIMLMGIFVGLIFIFVSPVINFILWLYYLVTGIAGV